MFHESRQTNFKFSVFYIYRDLNETGIRTLFNFFGFKLTERIILMRLNSIYAVKR